MFSLAKVSDGVYPISHSGETAEQLSSSIDLPLTIPAGAVVINHGLNHTRHFGNEGVVRQAMINVLDKTCKIHRAGYDH